jgi:carbon storage regulator
VLVFTRRRDEGIMIGDGVEVRVLRVGRTGVRLGVTAPGSVAVHRSEIYDQIRRLNVTAAASAAEPALLRRLQRAAAGGAVPPRRRGLA